MYMQNVEKCEKVQLQHLIESIKVHKHCPDIAELQLFIGKSLFIVLLMKCAYLLGFSTILFLFDYNLPPAENYSMNCDSSAIKHFKTIDLTHFCVYE